MTRCIALAFAALAALAAGPAPAQSGPPAANPTADAPAVPPCGDGRRPRVGVALGGGGARGFAHLAVLRGLEKRGIPVDCIAGTSMGALVGGLYASGLSLDEIESRMRALDWGGLFNDRLERPQRSYRRKRDDDLALVAGKPGIGNSGLKVAPGVLSGERVLLLLEELTQPVATRADFDALPVPFRAVATDLNSGRAVVIDHGSLGLAMRASMSIPGLFRPVMLDGQVLVDGGIANQVPVDVVRAMGADIVVAVDVGTPLARLDEGAGLFDIIDQVSGFLTVGSARAQLETLGPDDLLVQPALDGVGTGDFDQFEQALAAGEAAVAAAGPRLAALESRFADVAWTAPEAPGAGPPVPRFIELDNRSRYDDAVLLARIDLPLDQPLDTERLQANLRRIYGLDTFDLVTYDLVTREGETGVRVTVVPHGHGPNYLETGLSVYSDFSGEFFVNLRAGVLRAPVNPLGGELRGLVQIGDEPGLLLDWYQPLDERNRYFLTTTLGYESPRFTVFGTGGERLAVYRAPNWGGELLLGREFGNYGAATLGLRRRTGRVDLAVGQPLLPEPRFDVGEAELALTFDRIDNSYLPREGTYLKLSRLLSRRGLGADVDFAQDNLDLLHARAIGRHSGFAGLRWHASDDAEVPVQSLFRLGGLTRFAGYRPNERLVQNYALAYAGYTYELGRVLSRPAVLGGTVEYGRTWERFEDLDDGVRELHGSVYFGFDSWLGPLQLGYGIREGGEGVFLLELGRRR